MEASDAGLAMCLAANCKNEISSYGASLVCSERFL